MLNSKLLLLVAAVLIVIGITKPDFSLLNNKSNNGVNAVVEVTKPTDEVLLEKSKKVISVLKDGKSRKTDGVRLAGLYSDIATLIELDGENEVIKTTDEIRQANSLAGLMLRLNLKGDYAGLPEAAKDLIVSYAGDDSVNLDAALRTKYVDAFKALAWACNEGAK